MNDSFGNYLIQKIFEKINEDKITVTLKAVGSIFN